MRSPQTSIRRRGGVTVATLLLLPLLFLTLVFAVFAAEAVRARSAQQHNADAAALAIAAALVDDRGLSSDPRTLAAHLDTARQQGCMVARNNLVVDKGIELRDAGKDGDQGDIVVGVWAEKGDKIVPLNLRNAAIMDLPRAEVVQVTARRTSKRGNPLRLLRGPFLNRIPMDQTRTALAAIDRDIIGVRPLPGIPAPLAPLALFSDPSGKDKKSWEFQTSRGGDSWALTRLNGRSCPHPGCDGLHEMQVSLGCNNSNACLLQLGVQNPADLAELFTDGVREKHLENLGGELVLDRNGLAVVPGTHAIGMNMTKIALALQVLQDRGDAIVWPIYRSFDRDGRPLISGFVAARVVAVGSEQGSLAFLLQPAQRAVAALVAASSRGRVFAKNCYLARIRLADTKLRPEVQ